MLYWTKQFVTLLVYPLSLSLGLMLIGLIGLRTRFRKVAIACAALGIVWLWAASTPLLSGALTKSLERQYLPRAAEEFEPAGAIVVMGGCVGEADAPRIYQDLVDTSDRPLHAVRLYKADRAPKVWAMGNEMTALLVEWGVPADAIFENESSRSTYGDAQLTKERMEEQGVERVLLVTSAMHMPRALAVFRKQGITAIPAPTDYGVTEPDPNEPEEQRPWIFDLVPSAGALEGTTRAIHEYIGLGVYWLRGWI